MKNHRLHLTIGCLFLIYIMNAQIQSPITEARAGNCRAGLSETEIHDGYKTLKFGTSGSILKLTQLGELGLSNSQFTPAIFNTGIWMGGIDPAGQIRFAGTTYKNAGYNYDWFCGPMDASGQTNETSCQLFDKIFLVNRNHILEAYNLLYNSDGSINPENCNHIPIEILQWPAKGNPYWSEQYKFPLNDFELATFFDANEDGIYNPCDGDLPCLETNGKKAATVQQLITTFPTFLTFSVINDNGNTHRLSDAKNMKMEVHIYGFSYKHEDINDNLTFLKFKTLYKGDSPLNDVYFSLWVDPNVGCYKDDFIGTVPDKNLVYFYPNQNQEDTNFSGCFGTMDSILKNLPIIGFSYLKGFNIKKLINGSIESVDAGLTSSIYHNNCSIGNPKPATCDPETNDYSFYQALRGKWRTSEPLTRGGTGYNPGSTDTTYFVFDGNPANPNDWSMCANHDPFSDYRFLLTTGGANFIKGSTNETIIAITISQNITTPCPDTSKITQPNEKANQLFKNNWNTLRGPYAPDLIFNQVDNKLSFKLLNNIKFNNNNHSYSEKIPSLNEAPENYFNLEGYLVYQVNSLNYDLNNIGDENSVLVYQCDKSNSIGNIENWEFEIDSLNNRIWYKTTKVLAENKGISDNFLLDYDYLEDEPLHTNKEYYFVVLAYAYNNYEEFNPVTGSGQPYPYLQSSDNVKTYTVTLQSPNSNFSTKITRLKGEGTYNDLRVSETQREIMLDTTVNHNVDYLPEHGPFDIYIVDSSKIQFDNKYTLEIIGPFNNQSNICAFNADSTYYVIKDLQNDNLYHGEKSISKHHDQYFPDLGIAVSMHQPAIIGKNTSLTGGYSLAKLQYKNEFGPKWFYAIADIPDSKRTPNSILLDPASDIVINENQKLSNLGIFFPLLASNSNPAGSTTFTISPIDPNVYSFFKNAQLNILDYKYLNNVDIVFTSDKSKWSRCIVVESGSSLFRNYSSTLDDVLMLNVRKSMSVDKNGNQESSPNRGFGWFPGYAVDVETGERLNIFFGENTSLRYANSKTDPDISTDMIFNPNSVIYGSEQISTPLDVFLGGQHFIYVTRQKYDGCQQLSNSLNNSPSSSMTWNGISSITWAALPILSEGTSWLPIDKGLIPNDLTISLRVTKPFQFTRIKKDLTSFRKCEVEFDNPVYQFEVSKNILSSTSDFNKEVILPWNFKSQFDGYQIQDVKQNIIVETYNIEGRLIDRKYLAQGDDYYWHVKNSYLNNAMIFIRVYTPSANYQKSYKSILSYE